MAYMSQERKKALAPKIKAVLKKYGVKGTLSVDNHSTLYVNLKSGVLDLLGVSNKIAKEQQEYRYPQWGEYNPVEYMQVNPYWFKDSYKDYPEILAFLTELHDAMNVGNHDNSDSMTDYFDVGWYAYVNIGKYNSPYVYEG